jgi:hypothetical protein
MVVGMADAFDTFRCERHGLDVPKITKAQADTHGRPFGCPPCTAEAEDGPEPATMTGDDRAAELARWLHEPMTVAFDVIHQRVEKLVGRPVWTHEFATDHIVEEARSWAHPVDLEAHVIGSLDQLAGSKPVIVVRPERD